MTGVQSCLLKCLLIQELLITKTIKRDLLIVQKSFNEREHPRVSNGRFTNKGVQHLGEYVLTKDGKLDFGEVTKQMVGNSGFPSGKIRLRKGFQKDDGTGFGEEHIERADRLLQLKQHGFQNARDFVEDVCKGFDEVYADDHSLILHKKENGFQCVLRLEKNGGFYDIITAFIVTDTRRIKRKVEKGKLKQLWSKPLRPQCVKSIASTPIGFIEGTSDHILIVSPLVKKSIKRPITWINIEAILEQRQAKGKC